MSRMIVRHDKDDVRMLVFASRPDDDQGDEDRERYRTPPRAMATRKRIVVHGGRLRPSSYLDSQSRLRHGYANLTELQGGSMRTSRRFLSTGLLFITIT